MSYYVKVNGLDKIVFECDSEQIRERFISDGIKGDLEKIDAKDIEDVLFCPLFYANACVVEPGIKCFTYGDRAKLFWMMDEQLLIDGVLSETYFKNRVIEYVDSISEIVAAPDDYCEDVAELVDGFQKFKDVETNEGRVMMIVFGMLKYEADLVWCERIDIARNDLDDYFEMHGVSFDNLLSSLTLDLHQLIAFVDLPAL